MKPTTHFSYETSLTHGKGGCIKLPASTPFDDVMKIAVDHRCLIIAKTHPGIPNKGIYYLKYREQGTRIRHKTTPTQLLNCFYTDNASERHERDVWFIHY
jgi:hypothetical protein